jgi:hypothetical protein
MKIFNSAYPIVCLAMNKISEAQLAISISKAGCVPSISSFFYIDDITENIDETYGRIDQALDYFRKNTNNAELILSISAEDLLTSNFEKIFFKYNFSHTEVIFTLDQFKRKEFLEACREKILFYKKFNCKFILKALSSTVVILFEKAYPRLIDAYVLKSKDGAGSIVKNSKSLEEELRRCLELYPYLQIIVSGGIDSSDQINEWLTAGACAVGVGTLFALSKESCMSENLKNKLIDTSSDKIEYIETSRQNALVYSVCENDDINHSKSLKKAVVTGIGGIVFIGKGIDSVTEIMSVEKIVNRLTQNL